jgi:hypothetical protein
MITTNRYHHAHSILLLKPPPWLNNLHHQCIFHLLLIISTLFLQTSSLSSFVITIFGPYDVLAPRDTSPLLLIHPTLLCTHFHNKNHKPLVSPLGNTIHPIISSYWPPSLLLPTTPPPLSGNHLPVPPTPLSTHTTYQFPCTPENNLQHPLMRWASGTPASGPAIILTFAPININSTLSLRFSLDPP